METQSAFVVSRADRIGDLILALPALGHFQRNLKASPLASAPLILHHSPYTEDVAALALHNGLCDQLWSAGSPCPRAVKNPYFLSLQHNERVVQDLRICGAKHSLGPRTKISTLWTYARTVKQSRSRVEKSEMEYNVDLASEALRSWGVGEAEVFRPLPALSLPPRWSAPEKAPSEVVILSNRGSAGNWSWGRWLDKFLKRDSAPSGGIDFLYYGEQSEDAEKFFASRLEKPTGFRLLLNPFKKVSELAVYLKGAEKVYASSTGPLHLAHALGVAVHGVYPSFESSRVQSFKRWRPHGYAHASPVSYELLGEIGA